jgi:hypothetical protein
MKTITLGQDLKRHTTSDFLVAELNHGKQPKSNKPTAYAQIRAIYLPDRAQGACFQISILVKKVIGRTPKELIYTHLLVDEPFELRKWEVTPKGEIHIDLYKKGDGFTNPWVYTASLDLNETARVAGKVK